MRAALAREPLVLRLRTLDREAAAAHEILGRVPRLERRGERDALERRPGLTAGLGHRVELLLREVLAGVHGPHFAGRVVDHRDRGDEARIPVRGEHLLHRVRREPLHDRVVARVDLQPATEERVEARRAVDADVGGGRAGRRLVVHELIDDRLRERVADAVGAHRLRRQWLLAGEAGLLGGDHLGVDHRVEHGRAPAGRAVGVGDRVQGLGRLDQPREQRGLPEREQPGVALAEVALDRGLDAVRTVPEIDRVQVFLEDLVLRHLVLEPEREHGFADLRLQVPLLGVAHRVLDELLRDRGSTLLDLTRVQVLEQRPGRALVVDTVVACRSAGPRSRAPRR